MNLSLCRIAQSLLVALICSVCVAPPVLAEKNSGEPYKSRKKSGYYIGGAAVYNTLQGDFDGKYSFVKESGTRETVIIPRVDAGFGAGVLIGRRFPLVSVELGYWQSGHDAQWESYEGSVEYNAVSLNAKIHFMTEKKFQPHLLAGLSLPWVTIKGGAVTSTSRGDAKLYGTGINTGLGFTYFVRDDIFVFQDFYWRWTTYSHAEGKTSGSDISDNTLDGNGFTAMLGLSYIIY